MRIMATIFIMMRSYMAEKIADIRKLEIAHECIPKMPSFN